MKSASTLWPKSESAAGSSVIATSTAHSTTIAPAAPSAVTKGSPMSARPRNETATTIPAKKTDRPLVPIARTMAGFTSNPAWSPSR
jgi:hypothetical protein